MRETENTGIGVSPLLLAPRSSAPSLPCPPLDIHPFPPYHFIVRLFVGIFGQTTFRCATPPGIPQYKNSNWSPPIEESFLGSLIQRRTWKRQLIASIGH